MCVCRKIERERESVCVCVYVERDREREKDGRGLGTVRVWSRIRVICHFVLWHFVRDSI